MYLSIGQSSKLIGASVSTLRAWESKGQLIPAFRTPGGHRRFKLESIHKVCGFSPRAESRKTICYARVSSHDQKEDLERQKSSLEDYCGHKVVPYELISDLGSGLNYKKRGLKKLIRMILLGQVEKIVLTHKDRLLRFGSELIFYLCSFFHTDIELIHEEEELSDETRLAKDVLEILTVFSSRLYGKRAHKKQPKTCP